MLWLLLLLVLPYALYVFVDHRYGLKPGIVTALICVAFLGIVVFLKTGEIDELFFVDGALILIAGWLSIALKDSRWFKLQPTVTGLIFCTYIFYLQIFDTPLILRYLPMMSKLVDDPIIKAQLLSEGMQQMAVHLSRDSGFLLLFHALLNAYAALKWSNVLWLVVRVSILPMMMVLGIVERLVRGGL